LNYFGNDWGDIVITMTRWRPADYVVLLSAHSSVMGLNWVLALVPFKGCTFKLTRALKFE
jgi:hypothetical protein